MPFFRKGNIFKLLGSKCAQILLAKFKEIPDYIKVAGSGLGEQNPLGGIDNNLLNKELAILAYTGMRLAIQGAHISTERMMEICGAFDESTADFIPEEWFGTIDERGQQYFSLLTSHIDQINEGNLKEFHHALSSKFSLFCQQGNLSFKSMTPLSILAVNVWDSSFADTLKLVDETKL